MPQQPLRDSRVAAPADDGGHQGSFTVPEDVQLRSDAPPEGPSTNQDANPDREDRSRGKYWFVVLAVVVLLFMIASWMRF
jgi:hypothetical protein